ncbi:MAG: hypothetical protein CL819_03765 [Croceicoccus sp.]|nr:hypothetical protein [Croceicoccus sp.]
MRRSTTGAVSSQTFPRAQKPSAAWSIKVLKLARQDDERCWRCDRPLERSPLVTVCEHCKARDIHFVVPLIGIGLLVVVILTLLI